jgi:hypothetical protein
MDKSQWKISDRFIVMLAIAFGIWLLAMLALPASSGKLRGNAFALLYCRLELRDWKSANTNGFNFEQLSKEDKRRAIVLLGLNMDAWTKTNFIWAKSETDREIVIVCRKEFNNVPRPAWWNFYHKNPAHAVGYSDGTAELISPEAFTNLNLSGFISLSNLATNSELNIFK